MILYICKGKDFFMRDDEKMFNLGMVMLLGIVAIIEILQVCYREQNNNLKSIRRDMANVRHEYSIAQTRFSALSSADSLRNSVIGTNPNAAIVAYSKTVHINDIPMVEK